MYVAQVHRIAGMIVAIGLGLMPWSASDSKSIRLAASLVRKSASQGDNGAKAQARALLAEAGSYVKKAPNWPSTNRLWAAYIRAQIAAQDFVGALNSLQAGQAHVAAQPFGAAPDSPVAGNGSVPNFLLDAELKAGEFELALRTVREQGIILGHVKIASHQTESGDLAGAFQTYRAIDKTDLESDVARSIILGNLAAAYGARGDERKAAEMRKAQKEVLGVLSRKLTPSEKLPREAQLDPDVDMMAVIFAHMAMRAGDFEGALTCYDALRTEYARTVVLPLIAGNQAAAGRDEDALATAKRAPKGPKHGAVLAAIAAQQAARGEGTKGIQTYRKALEEMRGSAQKALDESAASMALGLALGGNSMDVGLVGRTIQDPPARAAAFLAIARIQLERNPAAASEAARQAEQAAGSIKDATARASSCLEVSALYRKLNDEQRERSALAAAAASPAKQDRYDLDGRRVVVHVVGRFIELRDQKAALRAAASLNLAMDRALALALVANGLAKQGQREPAVAQLRQALQWLEKSSAQEEFLDMREAALPELAEACVRLGNDAGLARVLATSEEDRQGILLRVSQVQVELARFEAALSSTQAMSEDLPGRGIAIGTLTRARAAANGLDLTLQWARGLPSEHDRACALVSLASWILDPKAGEEPSEPSP